MSDRESLRANVIKTDAQALLDHHRRGGLLLLAASLDLLDIACAVSSDDAGPVEAAIASGSITRPSLGELANAVVAKHSYQCIIVQPYVLAQQIVDDLSN